MATVHITSPQWGLTVKQLITSSLGIALVLLWPGAIRAEQDSPSPSSVPPSSPAAPVTDIPAATAVDNSSGQSVRVSQAIADPAEAIAPPGLTVLPGEQPISPYLALAMRQELEQLMGRFESALLLARASSQASELTLAPGTEQLTASAGKVDLTSPLLHPALAQGRQLLAEWSTLIEHQEYQAARQRWLATRQAIWNNFPMDRPLNQPEIRAVWLDRGTIVRAGSPQRLANVFDRLAAAGFNTVFFETVNAGYPIYPSRVAPTQNPLSRHWDPLAAAVELAHERDMELHAWIWTFAAGNQLHNRILNLPTDYPGPVLSLHPDWAGRDNRGELIPRGQTKPFLDPANPEVRNYLLRLIAEIITQYEVDGLQLDYIRYPFQDPSADRTFGYGQAARQRFKAMTGIDPVELSPRLESDLSGPERQRQLYLWERWTEFRIQQVSSFVAEVSRLVQRQRPELLLSAATFAKPERERLLKIQQDWEHWAEQGWVDWIVLMSYAEDANRLESLVTPWLLHHDYESTLVIPGIRLLALSEAAAFDQIQALRDLPAAGYALFAAENLMTGPVHRLLSQTQTATSPPQQQPYQAALERYRILKGEWSWLSNQGHLWLAPASEADWIAGVHQLEQDLAALAQQPSPRRLNQVRSQLISLRATLGHTMALRTVSNDYRLQTWRHRLTTIERLLNYGNTARR
ncbi:S-layer-related protein [Halomicronema hongdechloris C2206]|uniref:S-layer-related protein n=1 Tax=Halomicronema hongdechloris C2206 TaxID=1641165 RepID=A0A1Z3HFV3_9CYAN|nr:family 10 glycosylhydrolase [Halomicronema hongdechloris]ASC69173.1 S-layer-related protein [Halomicronema hongdechloris C2206]